MKLYDHPVTASHYDDKDAANFYNDMPHDPYNAAVFTSYAVFKRTLWEQWCELRPFVTVEAWEGEDNAYSSSAEMMADVAENRHLYTFVTSPDQITPDHPMAEAMPDEFYAPREFTMYNDVFRAVHDLLGHVVSGGSFGINGERKAWLAHRRTFPKLALPALWCETRGQASWTNCYGNHASLPLKDRPFGEQKAGRVLWHLV